MADFDALMNGMALFNDGMQKLGTTRAINQAQEQLQQINSMQADELQKRQQMAQLAQNLTLNLTKVGASPAQVQQAAGSLMPTPINNEMDAFMQGQLTGSSQLQKVGEQAQTFKNRPEVEERARERAWQSKEKALDRDFQANALDKKRNTPKKVNLSDKQIDAITGIEDDFALGTSLIAELSNNPWLVGPFAGRPKGLRGPVDPKFASFNQAVQSWFDQYRKNITGAAASDQELQRLEENRPNTKDSVSQFKAKVQRIIDIGRGVRERKLRNLERSGRDVSGFEFESSSNTPAPESQGAEAPQQKNYNKYFK